MNEHDLLESMSEIDEKILDRSENSIQDNIKERGTGSIGSGVLWGSIAAAIVLILGIVFIFVRLKSNPDDNDANTDDGSSFIKTYRVVAAEYPETEKYPNISEYTYADGKVDYGRLDSLAQKWSSYNITHRRQMLEKLDGTSTGIFKSFASHATGAILNSSEHSNRVYSPLNIYITLGMLAEISENNTRQQVLDVLGYDDMETMRKQLNALWGLNYVDDGVSKNVLAASLWLRNDKEYNKDTLQTLADYYYASSFSGEMGSDGYVQAYQNWLNEQTGGLLGEQVKKLTLNEPDIMDIATTIFFGAKWSVKFKPENNTRQLFHAFNKDYECDFMNRTDTGTYFWGEKFGAARLYFEGATNSNVLFILPDEGVDVNELLSDSDVMSLIENTFAYDQNRTLRINYSIPKFDVVSELVLNDSLTKLGITDAFDPAKADFSTLTENPADTFDAYIGKISHDVRVIADEEGIKAVAYTPLPVAGATEPPKEIIDFVLDRPFIFVINTNQEYPVFVGVVENP